MDPEEKRKGTPQKRRNGELLLIAALVLRSPLCVPHTAVPTKALDCLFGAVSRIELPKNPADNIFGHTAENREESEQQSERYPVAEWVQCSTLLCHNVGYCHAHGRTLDAATWIGSVQRFRYNGIDGSESVRSTAKVQ